MSVEDVFLSRDGKNNIQRILKFMKSMIIKVDTEANEFETTESFKNWLKFKIAFENIDSIKDYNGEYGKEELSKAGYANSFINNNDLYKKNVYQVFIAKKHNADKYKTQHKALMRIIRKKRRDSYIELNPYYRRYLGLPETKGQYIYVRNRDNPSQPPIPIHEVHPLICPKTYAWLITENKIKDIKRDHPNYTYLEFITNPLDVYRLRSAENFDLLFYDSRILNKYEMANFLKCYSNVKTYINKVDYIPGFQSRYDQYAYLMELLLLYSTFTSFSNSYLDKYVLGNYSDQEIYDILDSNNLSELKGVNIELLRKIIPHLPDLLEARGSSEIIDRLLDIINDNMLTIKRYDIIKKLPLKNNKISFDTDLSQLLDESMDNSNANPTYITGTDIVFREKVIRKGERYIEYISNKEYPYHEFISSDPVWAGAINVDDSETKFQLRENLRREILSMDFSSILTKYINISSALDIHSKRLKTQNLMGIIWQYNYHIGGNFMSTDLISIRKHKLTPLTVYAVFCMLHNLISGVEDYDKIHFEARTISSVMAMRDREGIIKKADGELLTIRADGDDGLSKRIFNPLKIMFNIADDDPVETVEICDIEVNLEAYDKTIQSILNDSFEKYLGSELAINQLSVNKYGIYALGPSRTETISDPILRNEAFNEYIEKNFLIDFDTTLNLPDLLKQYDTDQLLIGEFNNMTIIDKINDEIAASNNMTDYLAWSYLREQNFLSDTFDNMFNNKTKLSEYIKSVNSDFFNEFEEELNLLLTKQDRKGILDLYGEYANAFYKYVYDISEGKVEFKISSEDDTSSSDTYLDDLKLIFNNFLSIYSQIYQVEYNEIIDDIPFNRMNLLYLNLVDTLITGENGSGGDDPGGGDNPGGGNNDLPNWVNYGYRLLIWLKYFEENNSVEDNIDLDKIELEYIDKTNKIMHEYHADILPRNNKGDILDYLKIFEKVFENTPIHILLKENLKKLKVFEEYDDKINSLNYKSVLDRFVGNLIKEPIDLTYEKLDDQTKGNNPIYTIMSYFTIKTLFKTLNEFNITTLDYDSVYDKLKEHDINLFNLVFENINNKSVDDYKFDDLTYEKIKDETKN